MSTSFASQGRRGRIEEALERFREAQRRERLEAGGYDTIQTMSAEARALQRRKFASDAEARRHLADLRGDSAARRAAATSAKSSSTATQRKATTSATSFKPQPSTQRLLRPSLSRQLQSLVHWFDQSWAFDWNREIWIRGAFASTLWPDVEELDVVLFYGLEASPASIWLLTLFGSNHLDLHPGRLTVTPLCHDDPEHAFAKIRRLSEAGPAFFAPQPARHSPPAGSALDPTSKGVHDDNRDDQTGMA